MTHKNDIAFGKSLHYIGKPVRKLIKDNRLADLGVKLVNNNTKIYCHTLECVIANLIIALDSEYPDCYVHYSRNETDYKAENMPIYKDLSYTAIKTIISIFIERGLIEHEMGYRAWGEYDTGRRSAMRATPEFAHWLKKIIAEYNLPVDSFEQSNIADQKRSHVIVKDFDKKIISASVDSQLVSFNKYLDTVDITTADGVALTSRDKQIFSVEFAGVGGRIYSNLQNIPSASRAQLKLDGESVQEIDFKSSHIAMLYSLKGWGVPDDCYVIDVSAELNKAIRPLIKQFMVIVINSDSEDSAVNAMIPAIRSSSTLFSSYLSYVSSLREGGQEVRSYVKEVEQVLETTSEFEQKISIKKSVLKQLLEQIKQAHAPIAEEFCTAAGYRTMAIEGKLARAITDKCLQANKPVLNVHDSYICKQSDADFVQQTINEEIAAMSLTIKLERKVAVVSLNAPPVNAESKDGFDYTQCDF